MVQHRVGRINDHISLFPDSQTQIHIVICHLDMFVEAAHLDKDRRSHHHARRSHRTTVAYDLREIEIPGEFSGR